VESGGRAGTWEGRGSGERPSQRDLEQVFHLGGTCLGKNTKKKKKKGQSSQSVVAMWGDLGQGGKRKGKDRQEVKETGKGVTESTPDKEGKLQKKKKRQFLGGGSKAKKR